MYMWASGTRPRMRVLHAFQYQRGSLVLSHSFTSRPKSSRAQLAWVENAYVDRPAHSARVLGVELEIMTGQQKCRVDGLLVDYDPPEWVRDLENVPKCRLKLVHPDTPIQRWYVPGVPDDFELYIKRDDMTGSQLSGNKVRKLEFILADAVSKGCSTIISCGGIQSNHSRATCISARQLGLKTHLLLKNTELDPEKVPYQGNVLLDRLVGAQIHLVPIDATYGKEIQERADILMKKLRDEKGEKPYFVPCGGSNSLGLFGYVQSFQELLKQEAPEKFTDIAVAVGSGGTIAGLSMSNYLAKSNLKIHGMAVGDNAKFFHSECNRILAGVGWGKRHPTVQSEDLCEIHDGSVGRGYALSTPEELEFIFDVAATTGIILDPVYTGKAAFYLIKMMKERPEAFRGKKILFIHTGGIFSVFEGRLESLIQKRRTVNKVDSWANVDDPPEL
ncbi:bifunctional D-cysteine desulfhydrase/1-aminocyclopropane-1-carboxylate deaminase, mitochondrial-like [Acanthaster planci]|uniref:Bifunctional D-cysteine desulfhydrase/1-aminocyclopropane-1-carboxylate deaminase, mitochondrial-like n=1 Tax=Acanthaster planci TaxID=133434 RepID=A0A8B7YKP7_ACAPL|nr:bifunctional D-cysteine desulfhydrase/1-aminocyclopropane-1-carboxylate deaminase, mitochondrial-like [Acanthaster planci]